MYILIRSDIPLFYQARAIADAAVLAWNSWNSSNFEIKKLNQNEFDSAKVLVKKRFVLTEPAYDHAEVAIVVEPLDSYPESFKHYRDFK